MPQYYEYFLAKGFTYGAKLRWMNRSYLVARSAKLSEPPLWVVHYGCRWFNYPKTSPIIHYCMSNDLYFSNFTGPILLDSVIDGN